MSKPTNSEVLLKLLDQQSEIKVNLAEIKVDLKEHMRRTALLESRVEILAQQDEKLNRQVYLVHGGLGLIAIVGTLIGIVIGLQRIFIG